MKALATLLAGLLLLGPTTAGGAEACRCIVLVYRVRNPGSVPAEGVRLYHFLPQDVANQHILKVLHDREPDRIETDLWGQAVAVHALGTIPPGRSVNVRTMVWATWTDRRLGEDPAAVGTRDDVPADVKRLYLGNRTKYRLTSTTVRQAVEAVVTPGQNVLESARALHGFVSERVHYNMDGKWDDAVTVLKRGTGSCSEFTFAYVALCRAAGIPARYVGGTRQNTDRDADVDLWNHRWPEVYLPGLGWVSADRDAFGVWRKHALILACGDGGDDTPLGWEYRSACRAEKGHVRSRLRAYWHKSRGPDADRGVIEAAAGLRSALREAKLKAIRALASSKRRLAVPFLSEGLYASDGVVVSAAVAALIERPGRPVNVSLADALGETGRAETDEAVLEALRRISGKGFADAARWRLWAYKRPGPRGLRIRAFVDGRSKLVLTRSTAQWIHYAGMPPGLGDGRKEPTFIEGYVWQPRWPRKERTYGGELRCEPLRLRRPYPGKGFDVVLESGAGAGEVRLPESRDGTIAVLFQNTSGKAKWFDTRLSFEKK